MADYSTHQADPVAEGATAEFHATVKDEKGAALTGAEITSLTLTLIREDDTAEGTVVGDWLDKDVRNANGGTLESDGRFTVVIPHGDLAVVPPDARSNRYVALVTWTWAGGAKQGRHRHSFPVGNVERAP